MNSSKYLLTVMLVILPFLFASPVSAAAPDGLGPWADSVFSSAQGLMKNGLAVPAIRSDTSSALGVAENNATDGNFFSLGFGGNIVLGFDNGISSGVFVVEATHLIPTYPVETATVEVSENGTTWTVAGTVNQDGEVDVPEGINCAKYVRIIDTSDPEIMPDDIADGYDVDGVQALGESCNPTTPTPTSEPTPTPSPTPTSAPEPTPTSGTTTTTTTTSSVPGFPNTGGSPPCTAADINTIPSIIAINRVSPTSIFVSWGPDGGFNDFIVQYGFQDGNWQFNTNVSGFSTTINDLPANQEIWVQVAATDNCTIGAFGGSVRSGGGGGPIVPGFPNTGGNPLIPRLPNTGFGPGSLSAYWLILGGVLSNILTFYLARRAYKFSPKR